MSINQIRDLALRILGIYYLSNGLTKAFQIASIFSLENNPSLVEHKLAITMSVIVPLVFWILIGLLLTFCAGHVVKILWSSPDESKSNIIERPSLKFWIVLVGFFFLVSSLGEVLASVWTLFINRKIQGSVIYYQHIPQFITFILSIFCIVKASAIEAWLKTKVKDDSQQGHLQRPGEETPPGA